MSDDSCSTPPAEARVEQARKVITDWAEPWVADWLARYGNWPTGLRMPLCAVQDLIVQVLASHPAAPDHGCKCGAFGIDPKCSQHGDGPAAPAGEDVRAMVAKIIYAADRSISSWENDHPAVQRTYLRTADEILAALRPAPSADEIVERCLDAARRAAESREEFDRIATEIRKLKGQEA